MKKIERLHYITHATNSDDLHRQIESIAQERRSWIQFRCKELKDITFLKEASKVLSITRQYGATCIINDRVEIAKELDADGVHIGKEDMEPKIARQLLGNDKIIGCTANTLEDILWLNKQPIDYIGLGPLRYTPTKKRLSPIIGLEGYIHMMQELGNRQIHLPIIAIGGILLSDIEKLMQTGVHGIAVSAVIGNSVSPANIYKEMLTKIEDTLGVFTNKEKI
ncbi:thiamine phosphate synthase [Olivibacter sp. SDN3]|uniref:thiamine phosphate synthase n=1 Tax=Olivibacter sp. SDN3 TaxID=2764720 RepID=UPI001650E460|nr:thiamine phosphate synthase [Olivibacter sp. SDN3]QNL51195.1 thiamine phosphate synthase [Olivibacter sp. SDN3]